LFSHNIFVVKGCKRFVKENFNLIDYAAILIKPMQAKIMMA